MSWEWLSPVLALVGGAAGSGLVYRAARRDTTARQAADRSDRRQREGQGQREEWGRRFTAALDDIASSEFRRRELGRAVLVHLSRSELASDDERELAETVLTTGARLERDGAVLPRAEGIVVDTVEVVEDDEGTSREGRAHGQARDQGRP